MTLAQLINVLYNIVDRIYIGRLEQGNALELTGLGVCLPVISIIIAFANLIGMGGAPLFSIQRGKKDDEEAAGILGNCFVMLLLCGVFLTVVIMAVKKPVLYLLGATDHLSVWNGVCDAESGIKPVYKCPGIWYHRNAYYRHWGRT